MEHSDEFYYLDRPTVPMTQQTIINYSEFLNIGVLGRIGDISPYVQYYGVNVKDGMGDVVGALLWVPLVSHELLTAPTKDDFAAAALDK